MSILRTIGLTFLVALCLFSGVMKIQTPAPFVKMVQAGALPALLQKAQIAKHVPGFKFTDKEATLLVQAVGAVMVATSVMIIVGLGRRFAAFVLALVLIAITVCQHVDINDPTKTKQEEQMIAFKNLGIVGGLLVVAAGGGYHDAAPKVKRD